MDYITNGYSVRMLMNNGMYDVLFHYSQCSYIVHEHYT